MQNLNEGLLFDPALSAEIKDRFYYVDADPEFGQRLFFENSGGSLRLKASVEAQAKYQAFPDCPERLHDRSRALKKVQLHGIDDIMHIVFGASGGALISEMTASQAMFQIVGAILENCPGKSAVTSVLEHPSAYDAVKYYCDKTGKEFRVAQANPKTGGIDVEDIRRVVSPDTCGLVQETLTLPSLPGSTFTPDTAAASFSGASAASEREPSAPTAYSFSVPVLAGRCLTYRVSS